VRAARLNRTADVDGDVDAAPEDPGAAHHAWPTWPSGAVVEVIVAPISTR
jgi:hypothetical protein